MAKSVAIDFSGVMMFVLYDDRIEVLIPNCETGTAAAPHWGWLTSPKPGKGVNYALREALIGADIEIRGDSSGERVIAGFDYVFRINEVVAGPTGGKPPSRDPRNPADRQFVATRIRLYGGALVALGVSRTRRCRSSYGRQELIGPERLIWRSRLPAGAHSLAAKVQLGNGANRTFQLPAAAEIAIWNLDQRVPEDWTAPPVMSGPEDTDFAWNYHAYGLSAGDWAPIMQAGRLPVPWITYTPPDAAGSCGACKPCLLDLRTKRPKGAKRRAS